MTLTTAAASPAPLIPPRRKTHPWTGRWVRLSGDATLRRTALRHAFARVIGHHDEIRDNPSALEAGEFASLMVAVTNRLAPFGLKVDTSCLLLVRSEGRNAFVRYREIEGLSPIHVEGVDYGD